MNQLDRAALVRDLVHPHEPPVGGARHQPELVPLDGQAARTAKTVPGDADRECAHGVAIDR